MDYQAKHREVVDKYGHLACQMVQVYMDLRLRPYPDLVVWMYGQIEAQAKHKGSNVLDMIKEVQESYLGGEVK